MKKANSKQFFKLNGFYAKMLKAFCKLFGLQLSIISLKQLYENSYDLHIEVFYKNRYFESCLDVFEKGKMGYVSSMNEYILNAREGDIERICKKMLYGTFGVNRYIKSMKGDCYMIDSNELKYVPRLKIYDLPTNLDELYIRLDLQRINWKKCNLKLLHKVKI